MNITDVSLVHKARTALHNAARHKGAKATLAPGGEAVAVGRLQGAIIKSLDGEQHVKVVNAYTGFRTRDATPPERALLLAARHNGNGAARHNGNGAGVHRVRNGDGSMTASAKKLTATLVKALNILGEDGVLDAVVVATEAFRHPEIAAD
jgi:hypothetical protein